MQNTLKPNTNIKFFYVHNAAGVVLQVQAFAEDSDMTAEALTSSVANLGGYAVEVADLEERAMLRDLLAQRGQLGCVWRRALPVP